MEATHDKLILEPRKHRKDKSILRVISNGLEIRRDDHIATTDEERDFTDRVVGDLKQVVKGDWKRSETFEMTRDEASFALLAIKESSIKEFVSNNGQVREFDSFVANNARPEIEAFVGQAA